MNNQNKCVKRDLHGWFINFFQLEGLLVENGRFALISFSSWLIGWFAWSQFFPVSWMVGWFENLRGPRGRLLSLR